MDNIWPTSEAVLMLVHAHDLSTSETEAGRHYYKFGPVWCAYQGVAKQGLNSETLSVLKNKD